LCGNGFIEIISLYLAPHMRCSPYMSSNFFFALASFSFA
jgi:hypothetical protein